MPRAVASGVAFANLTSGSPDEGRAIAAELALLCGGEGVAASYVDGAYCGPPAKARCGGGQLFVSSGDGGGVVEKWRGVLATLGDVTFCGDVGASRALDYAVVDLALVNLIAYSANAAMLAREGVDVNLFAREAAKRLATTPAAIETAARRMDASRDETAYADAYATLFPK